MVAITSNSSVYSEVEGYKFVKKEDLKSIQFDFVLILAEELEYHKIMKEAMELGVDKTCIISFKALRFSNFNVERYINLQKNLPSIFSCNCWGGLTYNSLGLEFNSPLINMYESELDFIKLAKNPQKYMQEEFLFLY